MFSARTALRSLLDEYGVWQLFCRWFLAAVIVAGAFTAQAVTFTYIPIPSPAMLGVGLALGNLSDNVGINDNGQIFVSGGQHSFLRQPDGTVTTIAEPGTSGSIVRGINNAGQMVGEGTAPTDHGFFRDSDGTFTDLKNIYRYCGTGGYGFGINNVGQIVGYGNCTDAWIVVKATGVYQNFSCPSSAATNTIPSGINDSGQVVGTCVIATSPNPNVDTAFLRDPNGTITLITQAGWISSEARGINNAGQIVGNFMDLNGHHSFFRDTDGTISILQSGGFVMGINNRGQILGYGNDSVGFNLYLGTISNRAGVLSHIAAGGGWNTAITLVNTSSAAVPVTVALHNDDGSALTLPVTTTQQGDSQTTTTASVSATINPNATLLISTGQLASTVVGWADVTSSGSLGGYAIFRQTPQTGVSSEGTVPLQTQFPSTITLPYDNTAGFVMGVALANLSTASANVTATIWDDSGNQLGAQSFTIAGNGHTAFVLPTQLALTAGKRGIVKFQATGGITGLGLRFSPFGTFTSVPTL